MKHKSVVLECNDSRLFVGPESKGRADDAVRFSFNMDGSLVLEICSREGGCSGHSTLTQDEIKILIDFVSRGLTA